MVRSNILHREQTNLSGRITADDQDLKTKIPSPLLLLLSAFAESHSHPLLGKPAIAAETL